MALTCELCGSTNFVKDNGLFVCQGCGMKYTIEEAQRMMAVSQQAQQFAQQQYAQQQYAQQQYMQQQYAQQQYAQQQYAQQQAQQQSTVEAALNAVAAVAGAVISSVAQNAQLETAPVLNGPMDFKPNSINVAALGARETNNYACRAWQMLLSEYKGVDHPGETRQKLLISRARECLTLLDDAAMLEPNNHVLCLLIYENCKEIVSSAKGTSHYVKDDEGNWKRKSLDYSVKVGIPGQTESFDKKIDEHRKILEQQYLDAHPDEVLQRERLVAQMEEINGRLDVLKNEKKSHGFFDFSGKREVKDRMKPIEDELRGVRSQISDLDHKVDKYVDQLVRDLGKTHILLDF